MVRIRISGDLSSWRMQYLRNRLDAIDSIFADPGKLGMTKPFIQAQRSECIANIIAEQLATFNRE